MSTALDPAAMSAAIDRLADQILSAAAGQAIDLVGIRSRGDEVAERVFAKLVERGAQARLGVLDISLYRDDYEHLSSNPTLQSSSIDFPVDGDQRFARAGVADNFIGGRGGTHDEAEVGSVGSAHEVPA